MKSSEKLYEPYIVNIKIEYSDGNIKYIEKDKLSEFLKHNQSILIKDIDKWKFLNTKHTQY